MSALLQTGERIEPAQRDDDYADVSPMCNELGNAPDHAKRRRLGECIHEDDAVR